MSDVIGRSEKQGPEVKSKYILAAILMMAMLAATPALSESPSRELGWPDRVRVVYVPSEGREAMLRRFAPLNDYLSRMLGTEVEPISFDTYNEMIAYLSTRRFELAYLSPSTYSQSLPWLPLRVVAMELDSDGHRGYYSIIITRPDSAGQDLKNFSGRNFAFTSPESTSGFLVPLLHFLRHLNFTPGMFAGQVFFAGNHKQLVDGILRGDYDFGAVNNVDLDRVRETEPAARSLRVLWQSELIPGVPFCARPDLPESFLAAAQVALCNFGLDRERARLVGAAGFVPATEADYLSVQELESFRP
jgi:phosphonate transport system substrate-binding protein